MGPQRRTSPPTETAAAPLRPGVRMPTQVCITLDIEFSINGAFGKSSRTLPVGLPVVTCTSDGREHGLGFVIETLGTFGLTATFFVEALNYCYFGDAPMASVAERIIKAGHDVQLHLHPGWLHFGHPDWRGRLLLERPNDSCAGRTDSELDEMLSLGIDALRRWGVPTPLALRTGNLQADRAVYRAMARHGLRAASNIGCAISPPGDPQLRFLLGRHRVEGIVELPVLTYTDFRLPRWRHLHNLTITGASSREIEILLAGARAQAITPVVLLTHTFEFINRDKEEYGKIRPHPTNKRRFRALCRLIAENPGEFCAVSFADGVPGWTTEPELADFELRVPPWTALRRLMVGQIDDRLRVR